MIGPVLHARPRAFRLILRLLHRKFEMCVLETVREIGRLLPLASGTGRSSSGRIVKISSSGKRGQHLGRGRYRLVSLEDGLSLEPIMHAHHCLMGTSLLRWRIPRQHHAETPGSCSRQAKARSAA